MVGERLAVVIIGHRGRKSNEPAATSGRPGAASGSFSGTAVGDKISMAAILRGFIEVKRIW